jgi:HEPN domain-containing protein
MEWESYFNEASVFCKVASGAMKKGTLGNIVIYNVIGIAVENFLTTLLMREGNIPEHSSISGMLRELKKIMPVPDEFSAEVRFMNSFMNFCALEVTPEKIPTNEETARMLRFVKTLEAWTVDCLAAECKTIN